MFVEPFDLTSFHQSVTAWPRSEADLYLVAEKLVRLLDARFACILSDGDGAAPAFRLCVRSSSGACEPGSAVLETYLRRSLQGAEAAGSGAPGRVRQFQLSGEGLPGDPPATHLAAAALSAEVRSADGIPVAPKAQRPRRNLGWIAVGTVKPLGSKEEALLVAAAQRLSMLFEIGQLEAMLQLRSQFLSIASHELKTPLTSIYGVLQLQERMLRLKKGEAPQAQQERQQSFLRMVIRQVQRLNELIDGLLDVSRIQNGRFQIDPSETDVAAMLREAVGTRLNMISQEAGVKLQVEAPERLVAWVDPVRMEEVINNLMMNAIRFSPEGGTVRIRLAEDGSAFRLTVRDQGPSVPSEDRERIFQPFERAARTSRFGGLGLGLFISRQIAQLHGGNVSLVESVPGKGNVFEAHLPVRSLNLVSA